MQENANKIILQKVRSLYITYTAVITLIIFIISFIWYLIDQDAVIALVCIVSFSILLLMYLFYAIIYIKSKYCLNSTINQQYPENLNSIKTDHDAIILIHSMGSSEIDSGIDNLISAFKRKNFPFKIYHCYNPEDFKDVLTNEKAKYLWIFGHGWRGGITFKWGLSIRDIIHFKFRSQTNFRYCDLIENGQNIYPTKSFIAQLHCNNITKKDPSNVTLPEVIMNGNINPNMYHVSDSYNSHFSIWFTTRKLAKNLERIPVETSDTADK